MNIQIAMSMKTEFRHSSALHANRYGVALGEYLEPDVSLGCMGSEHAQTLISRLAIALNSSCQPLCQVSLGHDVQTKLHSYRYVQIPAEVALEPLCVRSIQNAMPT